MTEIISAGSFLAGDIGRLYQSPDYDRFVVANSRPPWPLLARANPEKHRYVAKIVLARDVILGDLLDLSDVGDVSSINWIAEVIEPAKAQETWRDRPPML
jgi:hypothetical protein